jgi:hypothetical protein
MLGFVAEGKGYFWPLRGNGGFVESKAGPIHEGTFSLFSQGII